MLQPLLKNSSYPDKYTYENALQKIEEYRTLWNNVSVVALPKMMDILGIDASIDISACIMDGKSEEECIQMNCPGTEQINNPKIGLHLSLGILGSMLILGFFHMVRVRKKIFTKI